MMQLNLPNTRTKPKGQLLKWVGSKFRYANQIVSMFPIRYNKYIEPFVGTGAVLATLNPPKAIASDILAPLIELWKMLKENPDKLITYYASVISRFNKNRQRVYDEIKHNFNKNPNPYDLLVISRTCYGGVLRFRKEDGFISTPIGPHKPIPPEAFKKRVYEWRERIKNTDFYIMDFKEAMEKAEKGDIVYCDPPYFDTQRILYGAQGFNFRDLYDSILKAKLKGARIALSIDGSKKSQQTLIDVGIPDDLFERELLIDCGASMLRRFQKNGLTMEGEKVNERLLLTW